MSELFDLSGRVAIVTGTSRGLGQYFARALAKAGADLVLTSRNRETLGSFEAEMKALGRRTLSLELDVRDQKSIQQMASAAHDAFGRLDVLVNNAGCNVRKPALDVTWDDWNLILDTNLRGSFFVAQAVARFMAPRNYGRIINNIEAQNARPFIATIFHLALRESSPINSLPERGPLTHP